MIDKATLWIIIPALGIGSYALRFFFIGLVGDRPLPEWVLRHLRYTAVAVLPGLVAPLVVWPAATGGTPDAPRLIATVLTVAVAILTRNVLLSIVAGALGLYGGLYLLG